jgi:hypothetical protein
MLKGVIVLGQIIDVSLIRNSQRLVELHLLKRADRHLNFTQIFNRFSSLGRKELEDVVVHEEAVEVPL